MIGLMMMLAAAGSPAGARLVIVTNKGGVTTVEYASAQRCQLAAAAVEAESRRRNAEARANLAPGTILIEAAFFASAFCIPD